ncbi:hypothetical protein ASG41_20180 [Modestobacter sp. Leaf380]|nr:hypothetical protein ASG41_20180 [Modestobacter sp. Leaf380]
MVGVTSTRPVLVLASGLSTVLLLAGCTSEEEGTASPAPTSAESSSAAPSSEGGGGGEDTGGGSASEDLTAGLLPADSFGAGSVAAPLSEAELAAGAASAADAGDVTITPESCDQAVDGSQIGVEDLDAFAAQSVTGAQSTSVQLISIGGDQDDPVGTLAAAAAECPQATISSPEIGSATITFAAVPVPDLGDGAAALSYTTTVTGPDGAPLTIPAVVGIVQDGDRLITLVTLSPTGAVDTAAFATLLEDAYDFQAAALD